MIKLTQALEKFLNRKLNFKKEVLLKDTGDGVIIDGWNVPETQPTNEELINIVNVNSELMDIDSDINLKDSIKIINVDNNFKIAMGYFDKINLTSEEWQKWISYISTFTNPPTRLMVDENTFPTSIDYGVEFKTNYIVSGSSCTLDKSATMWVFNNDTNNMSVYLPDIQQNKNSYYVIKNIGNRSITIYPTVWGQKIEGYSSYNVKSGASPLRLLANLESNNYLIV